jgi:glycine dehydrogenase
MERFESRHIGTLSAEQALLDVIKADNMDQLIQETLPGHIIEDSISGFIPTAMSEYECLAHMRDLGAKNELWDNFIGYGYYGTITPSPILRNVFQNPSWYTQYTPYQAEISQGRLEALLNFQTMVSDLTGLPLANASLLDEGTAAAEAMAMFHAIKNKKRKKNPANRFAVISDCFDQTFDVLCSRAKPLGIEVVQDNVSNIQSDEEIFGVLIQFPDAHGSIKQWKDEVERLKSLNIYVVVAADILSLALLTPPGEWGADAVVGNTQRLGVPMGYGGPHAAYFATHDEFKRQIPGRIIGVSKDRHDQPALRMALQTREQHIKRERATSNICTAQALLAIMASFYGVYHGPEGLRRIAQEINQKTARLSSALAGKYELKNEQAFDTLSIILNEKDIHTVKEKANIERVNLCYLNDCVQLSIDETTSEAQLQKLASVFDVELSDQIESLISDDLKRKSEFMTHPVFHEHRAETQLMRYIKKLESKDLSLVHAMIPLGSCTMKLNAATQLIPVSFEEFANAHPFAPVDQMKGYHEMFNSLSDYLCAVTGFTACSLQPNSGAQGEFTGLAVIREYHLDRGDNHRNVALIPSSAHGTNPASAVMTGMKVVVVKTDENGNIDTTDLKEKAEKHKDNLAALMVTYPSTHGVFETEIQEICATIHKNGGLVYMDGANMNAQVGYTSPAKIGADVCHLNLHKTFAIPHGGGGPGMGPICCNDKLASYLPGHRFVQTGGRKATYAVASAPFGSASILLISYAYIRLLGAEGLKRSTAFAILNANYIKERLDGHYEVLYLGENGRCAHELILDTRPFKNIASAEDIAKRLIDYGFHAPTLSFPVPGTLMIEPTESEDKREIDLFCDAMIEIKKEIDEIARGDAHSEDNVLHNAPHPVQEVNSDAWNHSYSREKAAYPLEYLREGHKFWVGVSRVDNAFGDRNLICTCPPIEEYMD